MNVFCSFVDQMHGNGANFMSTIFFWSRNMFTLLTMLSVSVTMTN